MKYSLFNDGILIHNGLLFIISTKTLGRFVFFNPQVYPKQPGALFFSFAHLMGESSIHVGI